LAYATVKEIDASAIPIIDVSPLFEWDNGEKTVGRQLVECVQRIGFFYIKNHGVDQNLIDQLFGQAGTFFKTPLEQKNQIRVKDYHRGFLPIGEATMSGAKNNDYKESFVWGWDVKAGDPDIEQSDWVLGPNRWPDFQPDMSGVLTNYIETVNALGVRLLRAFAAGMDLDHDHFVRQFSKPLTRAAVVYYPPQSEDMGENQFGVAPHTDYGCITLVYQDATGGLQVKDRGGDWLTAHPVPETFIVNVGDLLHRWSNNRLISNPHRVINASGRERLSSAVFIDPDWDTVIEPVVGPGETSHYPAIKCAEYIHAIYQKSFAYRGGSTDKQKD